MNDKLIVNKLLFYIQNKIHVTTKDAIVETCVKFYSLDEITDGISVLESKLKIRLSKRKNADNRAPGSMWASAGVITAQRQC